MRKARTCEIAVAHGWRHSTVYCRVLIHTAVPCPTRPPPPPTCTPTSTATPATPTRSKAAARRAMAHRAGADPAVRRHRSGQRLHVEFAGPDFRRRPHGDRRRRPRPGADGPADRAPPAVGAPLLRLRARRGAGRLRQQPGDAAAGRLDRLRGGAAPGPARSRARRHRVRRRRRSAPCINIAGRLGAVARRAEHQHPRRPGQRAGRPARLGRRDRRRRHHLFHGLGADRPDPVDLRVAADPEIDRRRPARVLPLPDGGRAATRSIT